MGVVEGRKKRESRRIREGRKDVERRGVGDGDGIS